VVWVDVSPFPRVYLQVQNVYNIIKSPRISSYLPHPLGLPDHHQAHNGLRQVAMQWKGSPSTRIAKWMKWIDDLGDIYGCATSPTSPTNGGPPNETAFGEKWLLLYKYGHVGIYVKFLLLHQYRDPNLLQLENLPPENPEKSSHLDEDDWWNLRRDNNSTLFLESKLNRGRVLDVPVGC